MRIAICDDEQAARELPDAYRRTSKSNRQIVIKGAGSTSVLSLQDVYYKKDAERRLFCF